MFLAGFEALRIAQLHFMTRRWAQGIDLTRHLLTHLT